MNEYDRMREAVARRSAIDPRLRAILRRIGKGTATFADTAEYSRICAEITGRELSGGVLELSDREGVCTQLLRDGYDDINDICGTVQRSLDEKQGLHIAPQKAAFPAERVRQIAHSLVDPTVPDETIQRRAGKSVGNVYFSFHDDYIKENAKFRSDAGLKCYINRVMGSKACSWCADLAGRYPYSYNEMPEDIFRRHDNCTCTVTFENGRQRQNVWTKRTWETPDKDAGAPEPTVLSREQAERLQNERLAGYKGLTNGGGSSKMESEKCEIHPDKVANFFLKPGAKHSKDFFDVGYTPYDIERLTRDLKNCFDYSKAVDKSISESGTEKFSIFADLGVSKKKQFRTVWQKDEPTSIPRIITAHREDG